jgi:hypothetical protein
VHSALRRTTLRLADLDPGSYVYALGELIWLHRPDLANPLTQNTGGRTLNFLKKDALEHAIQLVSEEVDRQYILTFQPKGGEAGQFHAIRVAVKERPDLRVKAREGYWTLP